MRRSGRSSTLLGLQILLKSLILQTANATEKIDLPGSDAQPYTVFLGGEGLTFLRKIGWNPASKPGAGRVDEGKRSALLMRYRAWAFQYSERLFVGPIVLEGQVDHLPHLLVKIEVTPCQVAKGCPDLARRGGLVGRTGRPVFGTGIGAVYRSGPWCSRE